MELLFLSFFLLFQPATSDTVSVDSEIRSATVFLSGAEVQREAEINLQKGTNHYAIHGLSKTVNEQTLQLRTSTDVVLESISITTNPETSNKYSSEISELEKRKSSLQHDINRLESNLKVLDQKLNVLLSNQDIGGENANFSASELQKIVEYYGQQFEEIENQRIQINAERDTLNADLKKVNQKLSELRSKREKTSGTVHISIHSDRSQQAKLLLNYFTPEAQWVPSYDVKVQDTDNPLTLDYKANILQATGNDWNAVNLTISSAEPRSSTEIPNLNPIYLGFADQIAGQQLMSRQAESANIQMDAELKATQAPSSIQAERQAGETAFSFNIQSPYTIESGGPAKGVTVESNTLPVSYSYYSFPKKRKQAYLTAKIDEWESLNLLRGSANLFLDNSFVGKTTISPSVTSDSLLFSLGKDDRIIVQREQIESFTEKNFFGNKVTETKGWEIQLRNTKSTNAKIEVVDQVPLSTNEDISVDLKERTGANYNESTGKLTWNLVLAPNESRTVRFVYDITSPSGKRIIQKQN